MMALDAECAEKVCKVNEQTDDLFSMSLSFDLIHFFIVFNRQLATTIPFGHIFALVPVFFAPAFITYCIYLFLSYQTSPKALRWYSQALLFQGSDQESYLPRYAS
jgi:hypothetical protein